MIKIGKSELHCIVDIAVREISMEVIPLNLSMKEVQAYIFCKSLHTYLSRKGDFNFELNMKELMREFEKE